MHLDLCFSRTTFGDGGRVFEANPIFLRAVARTACVCAFLMSTACSGGSSGSSDPDSGTAAPSGTEAPAQLNTPAAGAVFTISGSVGDGPAIDAEIEVVDGDGEVLVVTTSDSGANYQVDLPAEAALPVRIRARGGTDLVTGRSLDFDLVGIAVTNVSQTINVTPLSTLTTRLLDCSGAEATETSLVAAWNSVYLALVIGLDGISLANPMSVAVTADNVAVVTLANEVVGETVRRTRLQLVDAGFTRSNNEILNLIACDLAADGELNAAGDDVDTKTIVVFLAASMAVGLETAGGLLHVNGINAVGALDQSIDTILPEENGISVADVTFSRAMFDRLVRIMTLLYGVVQDDVLFRFAVILAAGDPADAKAVLASSLDTAALLDLRGVVQSLAFANTTQIAAIGQRIAQQPSMMPPIVAFSAVNAIVAAGNPAELSWASANAEQCRAGGGWSGDVAATGFFTTQPLATQTAFSLSCIGLGGIRTETIVVGTNATTLVPMVDLSAAASLVAAGDSVDLNWLATNADSCVASGDWNGTKASSGGVESVGPLLSHSSFTIDCTGGGGVASATVTVAVAAAPANQPPVAFFSIAPTTGKAPITINFDATASTDADGTVVGYNWIFGDGSPGAGGAFVSHTYLSEGTYTITLSVADNAGATHSSTRSVAVQPENLPPAAQASASPLAGKAPLTVTFSGAASSDADGSVVSYSWDFGDGTASGSGSAVQHTYATAGNYTAVLSVVDSDGATASAPVMIAVAAANVAPTALLSGAPLTGNAPLLVAFDGSASSDSDGAVVSYGWNFGDATATGSGVALNHTYTDEGTFSATLTVADDDGTNASQSVSIIVGPPNQLPAASAGATPPTGDAPLSVSFDGSGSSDVDGVIVDYLWNFADGSMSASGMTVTHTYAVDGAYVATLTVTDDDGASNTSGVSITVNVPPPPNQEPIAVASATPASGKAPLNTTLSAENSSDPDGSIAAYVWDFGDGSSTVAGSRVQHSYINSGSYTATLMVTDDQAASATASVVITVAAANVAPTALFTGSPITGKAPLSVDFDGSASTDPDGVMTSYEWDFGDGTPGASGVINSHTYAAEGAYTVTLRVRDDDAAIALTTTLITVTAPNQSPVASFGFAPGSGKAPLPIVFDASASGDSDGAIANYIWDFGDESTAGSGVATAHTYGAGSFTVTLTVVDDDGATHTQVQTLSIQPPNADPLAVATGSPLAGETPLLVTFDASSSTDFDGVIVAYDWDFGDGSALASGAALQHSFLTAGTYTVTLTIMDSDGALATDSVVLSVTEPDPPEPMLSFTAQHLVLNSGGVTELAWTATAVDSCLASGGWSGVKSLTGNEQIGPLNSSTSFTLSCSGAGGTVVELLTIGVNGSVTLQWSAPTENIDGSPLTDLAGFRIYSLDSTGVYNVVAELNDPGLTSYALDIAIGSYQFVMTAIDSDGNESGFSNSVVKTVSATSI